MTRKRLAAHPHWHRPTIALATLLIFAGARAGTGSAAETAQLRRDAEQMVLMMDGPRDKNCAQRKIAKTEVLEARPDGAPAAERWTVDRCGKLVSYRVRYAPNSKGGTDLDVRLEK